MRDVQAGTSSHASLFSRGRFPFQVGGHPYAAPFSIDWLIDSARLDLLLHPAWFVRPKLCTRRVYCCYVIKFLLDALLNAFS